MLFSKANKINVLATVKKVTAIIKFISTTIAEPVLHINKNKALE